MKFDRDIIAGIIVCALIVICWNPVAKMLGFGGKTAVPQNTVQTVQTLPPAGTPQNTVSAPSPVKTDKAVVVGEDIDMEPVLANGVFNVAFSPMEGSVAAFTFENFFKKDMNGMAEGRIVIRDADFTSARGGSLGVIMPGYQLDAVTISQVLQNGRIYVLERSFKNILSGEKIICRQEWQLNDNYVIDYKLTLSNPSDAGVVCSRFIVDGGDLENWSRLTGEKVRNPKHSVDYADADGDVESVDTDDDDFERSFAVHANWVSVNNKYMALILKSADGFVPYVIRERVGAPDDDEFVAMIGAALPEFILPAGGVRNFSFKYFAGPKIASELSAVDESAVDVMHLAWGPLDWLSKLLLSMLLKLHEWVGSYGWSIIILTVFVRLVFLPVTMKANRSMGKMRDVKPKIDELKAKYKDNPQELNMKTMELYRAEGINPLGGCLPILLQIPVFIALYQTLESAVQLRQQSFAWIADLSQPDVVAVVFGLSIHPLAIAMTLLMLLQQLLTPMSVDGMQRRMMLLMPVVMLFVLYNLPAGLTLYWTVSSIFSIGQMLLQRKLDGRRNRPAEGKK